PERLGDVAKTLAQSLAFGFDEFGYGKRTWDNDPEADFRKYPKTHPGNVIRYVSFGSAHLKDIALQFKYDQQSDVQYLIPFRNLQQSSSEDKYYVDLFPARNLQLPYGPRRKYEYDHIRDDVEEAGKEDTKVFVEAMAFFDERVPNLFSWRTCEDGSASTDGVVHQSNSDDGPCTHVQMGVGAFCRCQNSKVLQQNRQLDKENSGSVDYLGCIEPLLASKYAAVDYR
ncbi:MAG: hypothetical protein LQ346_008859, partial [Caloplaca aetnensis]